MYSAPEPNPSLLSVFNFSVLFLTAFGLIKYFPSFHFLSFIGFLAKPLLFVHFLVAGTHKLGRVLFRVKGNGSSWELVSGGRGELWKQRQAVNIKEHDLSFEMYGEVKIRPR